MLTRSCRSVLYVPADRPRVLDKARDLPADALIFDLEDAVAPSEKARARDTLIAELARGGFGDKLRLVRINALGTPWGHDDAAVLAGAACDAVLLPKVETPGDLEALAGLLPSLPVWAMLETPGGILNAAAICAHPRLQGVVMGTNDLAFELGARHVAGRAPLLTALQTGLLAARAHNRIAIDGVYNALRDADGLAAECAQGRDMGFDGKSLIHPAQIEAANSAFAPSDAEIATARRQIAAFTEAQRAGQGIAVVDGRIVETLHIATARATLAKAEAIRLMEAS
ncbi:MAG: CoA ester lyase [Limimaricola sp.]|uniref:HpcH/HpaI aldolase/citrate lyase family protein n=1 Tax=Limimaricola sp. TaxID=2211665 RepID=UPI001DA75A0E|nr:CoA ester lyase [Limimaricola sp.]MBI1417683.1 CoA ester lyase [Limimaricola sp.]